MQQSSGMMTGRLFLILAFMSAICALAMFGEALPDWARTLLKSQRGERAVAAQSCSEAPAFRPTPAGVPPAATALGSIDPPQRSQVPASGVVPVSYDMPAERVAADPFAQLQQRLRQLGAVAYRLETWGSDPQRFRFSCRVAVAGNPDCTKHFEATDPNAIQAMMRVLGEIESWLPGR